MKSIFGVCCAMAIWGLASTPVQAQCYLPCLPVYVPRTVVTYRAEWREERVPCVIQKVSYRKEVKQVPVVHYVPKQFDEVVRTSYYVPVPKVVERDVQRCVIVPTMVFDPCTGCCYIVCQPQWTVQKVRYTTYDYRKEERDQNVKVWRYVQQQTLVEQVRWIPEVTQENSFTIRRYCVMVPYQTTYYVPCWR